MKRIHIMAMAAVILILSGTGAADEGMYTFDNPPLKKWKDNYGFEPDAAWLERAMKAAVRFNNGGTGSFVSGDGLVMTNHHVGFDCIQKLSTKTNDYVKEGFVAERLEDEARCPDLELNVLMSYEDVTASVSEAAASAKDGEEAAKKRKARIAGIEKECNEKTKLRCNVIKLYGGGQYMLYRYLKHTDVRLVFAPEQQVAFFGGDFDNFTYPRYDFDVSFFRVYDGGKPFRTKHFFTWSKDGAKEGELVFVIGNPGTTGRQLTAAQLEFERDVRTPCRLRSFEKANKALKEFAAQSEENLRQAKHWIFGFENAIKAYTGFDKGLQDPKLFEKKKKEEEAVRKAVMEYEYFYEDVKDSWDKIAEAQKERAQFHAAGYIAYSMVSRSELLRRAVAIVQMVEEKKKPNEERLEEYMDTALESLELDLFSGAPIYGDLEKVMLQNSLEEALDVLGPEHPLVKAALRGFDPQDVAVAATGGVLFEVDEGDKKKTIRADGTKLVDVGYRKDLVKNGEKWSLKKWLKKLEKEKDPMMNLAVRINPVIRDLRKRYEDKVKSVEEAEGQKIAMAWFKVYGKSAPPDATFTLRISHGVVKGYEAEGTIVPFQTNFYGMYARSFAFDGKPPFDLPERWLKKKSALDMSVPLNFVSTPDITGGNSGSPVINRSGEIVGLIFDGNIDSLVLRYAYSEEKARAVSVHSSGIREALVNLYKADRVAKELGAVQSVIGTKLKPVF